MARRCEICGKGVVSGHKVSHSEVKTKRTWAPNLQRARVLVNGRVRRIIVCTSCLRSGKVERAL